MSEATPEALRAMLFAAVKRQSTERYNALLAAAQKAPVPWDAAIIKGIAFQVSPKDFEIYSVHPGFDLQERLEAVATARKDFHRSVDDLLRTRDELAEADAGRKLHDKATAARFDHIEAQAQKKMSSAAADAVTLAYYSKRLKRRVAEYDRVDAFANKDPQHQFIQCLRHSLQHSGLVRASYHVTMRWDAPGRLRHRYTMIINKHEIQRAMANAGKPRDWTDQAKQYIEAQGEKLDILALFEDYRNCIDELHTLCQAEIEAKADPNLTDFRRVKDMITRVRMTQALRLLLPTLIAQDVDPYAHWQNYLTSEELEELETMPRHSAQQVGQFIDIADANLGLCDDRMREMIHRLFKVQR